LCGYIGVSINKSEVLKWTNYNPGHRRFFTQPKSKAYDQLSWVNRESLITNPMTSKPVFQQKMLSFQMTVTNAINIVAQKYFSVLLVLEAVNLL